MEKDVVSGPESAPAPSPYADQPEHAFWRAATNAPPPNAVALYKPKFEIEKSDRIATAGSCFAQHVTTRLKARGFSVLDKEPAPDWLTDAEANAYGYRMYSARYGNVYTARQLRQLVDGAFGRFRPERWIWPKGERWIDGLRPNVEPEGLERPDDVEAMRADHLAKVRELFEETDVFIFTLGLVEAWRDKASGTAFPIAPGVLGGVYDPDEYDLHVARYADVYDDLNAVRSVLKAANANARVILTVSPVPLTATATVDHVVSATTHAKSTLRAVAGDFAADHADVAYFPSYETIASHWTKGVFYDHNLRTITPAGVDAAMGPFFAAHDEAPHVEEPARRSPPIVDAIEESLVCEEIFLDAERAAR